MKRKICVVTGTRAEYGLLKWLMREIENSPSLELQVIATGQHLSPKFGFTYEEIEADGFFINKKVDMMLNSDSSVGVTKSMGLGFLGFSEAYESLSPDLVLVLGDRYEILSAVTSAMIFQIPIAHIHGGETTEGAIDEAIRHSITKMSHLHFVGADEYRKRVIQLGEQPRHVFLVGGLAVDAITQIKLLDRHELEKKIGFKFLKHNLLVTFHPVTLEKNTASYQICELLKTLETLSDTGIIFTAPNSDPGNAVIFRLIEVFCKETPHAQFYTSLGQLNYLSCVNQVDALIGNSSSGLAEAPTFKIATINVGDRQSGRLKATSVIDCEANQNSISQALVKAYSPAFRDQLKDAINPYGSGGASKKIVDILASINLDGILKKTFFNIPSTQYSNEANFHQQNCQV
jgi:GDP/UDP-N,N'-diacetylbacillosamine 2-epimerase (hydrolysing)